MESKNALPCPVGPPLVLRPSTPPQLTLESYYADSSYDGSLDNAAPQETASDEMIDSSYHDGDTCSFPRDDAHAAEAENRSSFVTDWSLSAQHADQPLSSKPVNTSQLVTDEGFALAGAL